MSYVIDFHDALAVDRKVAGGKAANLAYLVQSGFPVLEGLMITTSAYHEFLTDIDINSENQMESIKRATFPDDLYDMIFSALTESNWLNTPLAIRSSATLEDSSSASFAGLYDTYLNVKGMEEVCSAIQNCWASNFSQHVRHYQQTKQIESSAVAILIQPMVNAICSGIVFTANPITGKQNEIIVHAVSGLGEGLVSGTKNPNEWVVSNGNTQCLNSTLEKVISEQKVLELAELAERIAQQFGSPQDIEWSMDEEQIYILQARPMIFLTEAYTTEEEIPAGYWEREISHYPLPLAPLNESIFLPIINQSFRHAFELVPLLIETIELRNIGGYIYKRVVPLGGKERSPPPDWLMFILVRLIPILRKQMRKCEQSIDEDRSFKVIQKWMVQDKPHIIQCNEKFKSKQLSHMSCEELQGHLSELIEFLKICNRTHMEINWGGSSILGEFSFVCRDLLGWDVSKALELLNGLSEKSSDPSRALWELTKQVKQRPVLLRILESNSEFKLQEIKSIDEAWFQQFEHYLQEYGYRTISYDFSDPTYMEIPDMVLQFIIDQINKDYNPIVDAIKLREQREARLNEARQSLKQKPHDLERFTTALQRAELTYPLREEHGFYDLSVPLALIRMTLLEAGYRFVQRGFLIEKKDVFYLERDELQALFDRTDQPLSYKDAIRLRQEKRKWLMSHQEPISYGTEPAIPSFKALPKKARLAHETMMWMLDQVFSSEFTQENEDQIRGIPASTGIYTGTVRIVYNESQFDKIQTGDVLVCPITSPSWSVLFSSIGALITDSGGILSHSAIIAREYRIPTVVATGSATQLLEDGQMVTVNGNTGQVIIVKTGKEVINL